MNLLIAITGASGSIYGLRLVEELLRSGERVTLTASDSGIGVCNFETGINISTDLPGLLKSRWNLPEAELTIRKHTDFWAPEASGSSITDAMVVSPCSMGTLGRIASGISGNLIERAADVMLKEGRPLLLLPRESPLSSIHLENMLRLSRAGARIIPAMPAFYHLPESVNEMVDFIVGKVLDQLGVKHNLFKRWGE